MKSDESQQEQPGLWEATADSTPRTQRRDRQDGPRRLPTTQTDTGSPPPRKPPVLPDQRPATPMEFQELWDIDQVSNYLGVPKQTIYGWRSDGKGPKGFRVGKHLRWHVRTVIAWTLGLEREQ